MLLNHFFLLAPQLGHWDLWANAFFFFFQVRAQIWERKQKHRNKPTMCLLWASDLGYECGLKNN